MTTAKPLARYGAMEGARASGFAIPELHHHPGHDPEQRSAAPDDLNACPSYRTPLPLSRVPNQFWRNARKCAAQPLKLRVKEAPETDRFLERGERRGEPHQRRDKRGPGDVARECQAASLPKLGAASRAGWKMVTRFRFLHVWCARQVHVRPRVGHAGTAQGSIVAVIRTLRNAFRFSRSLARQRHVHLCDRWILENP